MIADNEQRATGACVRRRKELEAQVDDLKARIRECRSCLWFSMTGTDVRFSQYPYLTKVTDLRVKKWRPADCKQ